MMFLQARYLIFLLPLGVSVFLLMVSLLFSGGDDEANGDSGDAAADNDFHEGKGEADSGDGSDGDENGDAPGQGKNAPPAAGAPRSLLLNGFALAWGVFGIGANRILFPSVNEPALERWWPVLLIALAGGMVGAWVMRQFARRLMPGVQTQTVSRNALFGLTGSLLFTATESSGRVRVYDEFGTLHDEPCRVVKGASPVAKGRKVRIVDRDETGRLVVEEVL